MPRTRITITIDPELVERADRRARALRRSRSWVLGEALRAYLDEPGEPVARVREPAAASVSGLGSGRQAQLEADLLLTPEERVFIAEQTALIAMLRGRRPSRDQLVTFDTYEDFVRWRDRERIGP